MINGPAQGSIPALWVSDLILGIILQVLSFKFHLQMNFYEKISDPPRPPPKKTTVNQNRANQGKCVRNMNVSSLNNPTLNHIIYQMEFKEIFRIPMHQH